MNRRAFLRAIGTAIVAAATPDIPISLFGPSGLDPSIFEAQRAILTSTRYRPQVLYMGIETFRHLQNHPDIIAMRGHNG